MSQIAKENSEPLKKEDKGRKKTREERHKGRGVGRHDGWDLVSVCIPPRRTRFRRGACWFSLKLSMLQPAGTCTCEAEWHGH